MISKSFINKAVKILTELGFDNLLNRQITYQDIKDRTLTNLFCYEDNPLYENPDFAYYIYWVTRKLKKINKMIVQKKIDENIIKVYKDHRLKLHNTPNNNVSILSNIFSKNYVLYTIEKDKIIEKEITKEDIKFARKNKSNYKIIKDQDSGIALIYECTYLDSLEKNKSPNPEKAVGGIVTSVITDYKKTISTIESYSDKFNKELTALDTANKLICSSIAIELLYVSISTSIMLKFD